MREIGRLGPIIETKGQTGALTVYRLSRDKQYGILVPPEKQPGYARPHILMMSASESKGYRLQDRVGILNVGNATTAVLADGHGPEGDYIADVASQWLPGNLHNWIRASSSGELQANIGEVDAAINNLVSSLGQRAVNSGAAIGAVRISSDIPVGNPNSILVQPSDVEIFIKQNGQFIQHLPPTVLADPAVWQGIIDRGGVLDRRGFPPRVIDGGISYGIGYTFGDTGAKSISSINIPLTDNDVQRVDLRGQNLALIVSDGIRTVENGVEVLTGLLTYANVIEAEFTSSKDERRQVLESNLQFLGAYAGEITRLMNQIIGPEWNEHSNAIDRALVLFKDYIQSKVGKDPADDITVAVLEPGA